MSSMSKKKKSLERCSRFTIGKLRKMHVSYSKKGCTPPGGASIFTIGKCMFPIVKSGQVSKESE